MGLLEVGVAVAVVVGLIGIVVPLLPGTLLVLLGIGVWALDAGDRTGWLVLGAAAVVLALGAVLKYVVPGRRLKDAGIPSSTQWTGVAFGAVGFFVVPVVGLFLGFVLGMYVAERRRVGAAAAGPTTRAALRAVGLSVLIELVAGVLAAGIWLGAVVAT